MVYIKVSESVSFCSGEEILAVFQGVRRNTEKQNKPRPPEPYALGIKLSDDKIVIGSRRKVVISNLVGAVREPPVLLASSIL